MNYSLTTTEPRVDAFTSEVIRSAVVAITAEMKTNLQRTAYNQIIYEALDFTVGLFDAEGNTISIGLGLPMFIRGLSDAIKAKLEFYGRDGIEPGDILLTNDSYIMGSHLNHMIFTLPIFWEGEIVAFASSMAHWQDVGGVLRGATQDIYSEGLQLPIVKIFKRGEQDRELSDVSRRWAVTTTPAKRPVDRQQRSPSSASPARCSCRSTTARFGHCRLCCRPAASSAPPDRRRGGCG